MKKDLYSEYNFHESNDIHPTAIIHENVIMGHDNRVGPFTVIGSEGEILNSDPSKFRGGVVIGDGNVINSHVTIDRPEGESETSIGNNNLIMRHTHIGHDVVIGSNCIIRTHTVIAGHCVLYDFVNVGLNATIIKRSRVGFGAYVGAAAMLNKHASPYGVYVGTPAKLISMNRVQAEEQHVPESQIFQAEQIFKFLESNIKRIEGNQISDEISKFWEEVS